MNSFTRFALLFVFVFVSSLASAAYDISRKRIYYYEGDRGSSFTVTNTGESASTFNAYATPWTDATKASGIDMVAYPPVFTLQPGQTQTLRLLLRTGKRSGVAPLFYRLNIEERPVDQVKPSTQVVQLSMSLPVYYISKTAVPRGEASVVTLKGKKAVTVKNTSDTIMRITHFSTSGEGFRPLDEIILPGRTYGFVVDHLRPPYRFRVAHGGIIEAR